MESLAVTRFNNKTWDEYQRYRDKYNINGACYATPVKISELVIYKSTLYVFEMNNDLNIIMGVGIIINTHSKGIKHNIYSDYNYNRYNYSGKKRISRDKFYEINKPLLLLMEKLLFKSSTHYKRGSGIQIITNKKLNEITPFISKLKFIEIVKSLFN